MMLSSIQLIEQLNYRAKQNQMVRLKKEKEMTKEKLTKTSIIARNLKKGVSVKEVEKLIWRVFVCRLVKIIVAIQRVLSHLFTFY
jgi:hypothetical protein